MKKLKIRKGDTVRVLTGNSKNTMGKVLSVNPEKMRVVVEGVNIRKRHMRPTQAHPEGRIAEIEMPIHYSNVMVVDGDGKTTRIGSKEIQEGGKTKRVRIARTTGQQIL